MSNHVHYDLVQARAQIEAIAQRAKSDPAYHRQLRDHPRQTLLTAGLAEEIIDNVLRDEGLEGEVAGYVAGCFLSLCHNSCYITFTMI
jgi:hypothetical protein